MLKMSLYTVAVAVLTWMSRRPIARALSKLVTHVRGKKITARLNAVYSHESSELDPVLQRLQAESLKRADWTDL
jgi:hypothetical protein